MNSQLSAALRCVPTRPEPGSSRDHGIFLHRIAALDDGPCGLGPSGTVRLREPGGYERRAARSGRAGRMSCVMIRSMLRSARAVIVTNGLTPIDPGIRAPSVTYRPG